MRRATLLLPWLGFGALAAQGPVATGLETAARSGVAYQAYFFGSGLAFDRISELTIPVSVAQQVGKRLTLDVSTAFASASIRTVGGTLEQSGPIDTDVRAALAVVPGRVVLTVVGSLPTGHQTVPDTTLPLFGATATDLLGFMTPSFGSGGAVTAGFASAFRLGERWAAGTGASYRYAGSYVPVKGGGTLSPGAEGRVRLGLEGPLGRGYFRGALVYTVSEHDEIVGGAASIIGDRILAYASLGLPLGRGSLTLYGWDMRRFRPRLSTTVFATAIQVPRGNVLAVGARLDRPLSPTLTLSPSLEIRHELSGTPRLQLLGYLIRPGADLRYRFSAQAALVVRGHLAVGRLYDEGTGVSLLGPQLGALLEWTR